MLPIADNWGGVIAARNLMALINHQKQGVEFNSGDSLKYKSTPPEPHCDLSNVLVSSSLKG